MNKISWSDNFFANYLKKYGGVIGALLLLCLLISLATPRFFTTSNVINVLRQISINAIIAFGMTLVILTGGIDLSVGAVVALTGTIVALVMSYTNNIALAIVSAIVIGLIVGLFNGFMVSRTGIPPFVVTLCSLTICRGTAYIFTDGKPIRIDNPNFANIGNGRIWGLPVPVLIMLGCFIVCVILLNKTKFGRYVYALGGSPEAARYSGIKVAVVETKVYILSGILTAITGVIMSARLRSGQPTSGEGYELDAIAAVVIGGTSMKGGLGALGGTILGALVIGILSNGLNLLKAQYYLQVIMKGVVILLAVYIDLTRNRMKNARELENQAAMWKKEK